MENRNGLVANAIVCPATGTAERDAALAMTDEPPGNRRATLGADKNYDTKDFVKDLRGRNVTPHVAQNEQARRRSAIDDRTTRHAGYQISQKKRKRVEEIFGGLKTIGGMRKQRYRGLPKVDWMFTFAAAACNLVRIRNLTTAVEPAKA
jgi:IS5 family transposase